MGSDTFCTAEQESCVARHSKTASMVSPSPHGGLKLVSNGLTVYQHQNSKLLSIVSLCYVTTTLLPPHLMYVLCTKVLGSNYNVRTSHLTVFLPL